MKQIFEKIECFILAFLLTISILSNYDITIVKASGNIKMNKTHVIVDKDSSVSLSVINTQNAKITWLSENPDIADVDENGTVTGIEKGSTGIIAKIVFPGSSNVSEYRCEVGVKTLDYLPQTPENETYLAGSDIAAGKYVIFSDHTSSLGAFWEIDNLNGDNIIKNGFTKEVEIITVFKSQRLVIHNGYAISISAVSQGMLKLGNLYDINFLQM
jgi:hypothetical protein